MNKFFTKIIGASLAIAMMIGVGVGITDKKQAKPTYADDTYSLTPNAASTGSSSTSYVATITEFTHAGISWKMNQWNPSTLQIKTNQSSATSEFRFYNTSAFSGKIKQVVITFSALTVSDSSKLIFLGGSSEVSATSGGTAGTWNGTAKTLTWTPANSTNYTYFAFYQNGKAASGSNFLADSNAIVVTYASSSGNKTVRANSVTIKSGSNEIPSTYEPNAPYYIGDTLDLSASEVVYQTGDDYEGGAGAINWSSSNTDVASVSNGVVTFVSAGTTTITATAVDKGENNATVSNSFVLNISNATATPGTAANPYTVEQALAISPTNGVYVKGIVSSITSGINSGAINYKISDDGTTTNELNVYKGKYTNNTNFTSVHQIAVGDRVTVTGNVNVYSNANQLAQGNYITSITLPKYTVTYNANNAGSGSVPVDETEYQRNTSTGIISVTTKTNSGNLQREGYTFNGWNTKADPTANGAAHYAVGQEIQITGNTTLYAEWLSINPSITVQANLSGYTQQHVDLAFACGNIADESLVTVVPADEKITTSDLVVDGDEGLVTINFVSAGDTSLSFQYDGVEVATCAVTVYESEIAITGLPAKGKVQINGTLNLGAQTTITNSGIYSDDVVWESDDTSVATVSDSGVVTGKAIGQATITVTSLDKTDVYQSCVVSVYKGPVSNALDLSTASYDSQSDSLVTWSCDYAVMTNAVGTGNNTKPNNYLGGTQTSTRMYKNNVMTITPNSSYIISLVEFYATTNNYGSALKNSTWNNATATINEALVTVTPTDGSVAFGATIGNTCGFTTVKIYISPVSMLKASSVIKTISGTETNEGVNNVALRFGGIIPVSTWNTINSNWAITDYGVMFARGSMLTARSLETLEAVFRNDADDVAMVHRGSVGTPNANGDNYVFTARLNLEEADYDEVFYAAPFIVAGGEYYFLPEMHYSVRTLAEECYNNGGSSLSQTALATLKGNN